MSYKTIPGTTTRYALLSFDETGVECTSDPEGIGGVFSRKVLEDTKADPPSHVFLFSHGWKGDVPAAVDQYNRWMGAMLKLQVDSAALGAGFRPLWIGLHWPSLPFGDEEFAGNSFAAGVEPATDPSQLVDVYQQRLGVGDETRPLLETIVEAHRKHAAAQELPPPAADAYRALAAVIGRTEAGEGNGPESDAAPFHPDAAFDAGNAASAGAAFGESGGFLGGILGPLRQLSYWTMKKRARSIGESGMHDFTAALMGVAPAARFHLMGHSFGTIVMSGVVGGLGVSGALPRAVDSLALVQGAVSLWSFAESNPFNSDAGYFHPFLLRNAVRGPMIVTRSKYDKAVGVLYPLASQVSFASPDFVVPFAGGIEPEPEEEELPRYGAIGAFGVRGRAALQFLDMLPETGAYHFESGKIYNLESSRYICKMDGISGAHSDIDGPQVAHALWQAASI